MGGMLVLGITYVIWGFIAPRFAAPRSLGGCRSCARKESLTVARAIHERRTIMQVQRSKPSRRRAVRRSCRAPSPSSPSFCLALAALPASAQTLDRIRDAGRIKFGYLADARPFSFAATAGAADGYARRAVPADRRRR